MMRVWWRRWLRRGGGVLVVVVVVANEYSGVVLMLAESFAGFSLI